jgi:hypothetical protein
MFPVQQGQDDFQAGRITQGLENVHHPGDGVIGRQHLLCLSHLVFMNAPDVTDIHLTPQYMNNLSYDKSNQPECQPGCLEIKTAGIYRIHSRSPE